MVTQLLNHRHHKTHYCYHDLWSSGLHPSLPSGTLPGTFAPQPGLIHTATLLRPWGAEGPLCMYSLGDINPRLNAPAKQRKHLLTAKALTNSAFQMNPDLCNAAGGEHPWQRSSKRSPTFTDYEKKTWLCLSYILLSWLAKLWRCHLALKFNTEIIRGVRTKRHIIQLHTFLPTI